MEIFPNRISNQVWFENSRHTYLLTVAMIYPTVMGFPASTVIQISRRRHVLGTKTWWNSTVWTPRKSYGHLLAPAQIRIGQDGRHWNRSTAWNNDFLPGISPHWVWSLAVHLARNHAPNHAKRRTLSRNRPPVTLSGTLRKLYTRTTRANTLASWRGRRGRWLSDPTMLMLCFSSQVMPSLIEVQSQESGNSDSSAGMIVAMILYVKFTFTCQLLESFQLRLRFPFISDLALVKIQVLSCHCTCQQSGSEWAISHTLLVVRNIGWTAVTTSRDLSSKIDGFSWISPKTQTKIQCWPMHFMEDDEASGFLRLFESNPQRIGRFMFCWISHPMKMGDVSASARRNLKMGRKTSSTTTTTTTTTTRPHTT